MPLPSAAGMLLFERRNTGLLWHRSVIHRQAARGSFACSVLDQRFGNIHTLRQQEHGNLKYRLLDPGSIEAEVRVKVLTLQYKASLDHPICCGNADLDTLGQKTTGSPNLNRCV